MRLNLLQIHRVRCLLEVEWWPGPGLNLIVGANGSGKSSCLEAIYLLGLGRSFRSRTVREVITFGETELRVHGRVQNENEEDFSLGIERGRGGSRVRIAGQEVSAASELARHLPILLITPESQRLLTDGGRLRRRLLDWALFHVEPAYFGFYQRYRQALRQRNASLRQNSDRRTLHAWDGELDVTASQIHESRARYVDEIKGGLNELVGTLLGKPIEIDYFPGWDVARSLAEVTSDDEQADRRRGYTGHGPHRADLRFSLGGAAAHKVLSRGEGKLFVAAVLLAQTAHVMQRHAATPVVLIDDLASELDSANRDNLLSVVQAVGAQIFVTAVTGDELPGSDRTEQKMFHVERGLLLEMV